MARKASFYYNKTFISNDCGLYTVKIANNLEKMLVVFELTGTEVWVSANQIDTGRVIDRFRASYCGIGYLGNMSTVDEKGIRLREYDIWTCMLDRCYGDRNLRPYKYCIVSEEFQSFEYFYLWYKKQIGSDETDWQLDKDILSDSNSKIYSEDTCVLVPTVINSFFVKHNNKKITSDFPSGVSYVNECKDRPFMSKYNGHGGKPHLSYHDNEW